ncbi:MAG: hypothetical protein H0V35_05615 [Nitrospira sp.]|nr:hypothetical protein [Nitrospira sp.]
MPATTVKRRSLVLIIFLIVMTIGGVLWFANRYDDRPQQMVTLTAFSEQTYPDNPENTSQVFGAYPHRQLKIEQMDGTHFRFLLQPAQPQAATIELTGVDLAHFVAAVPPWVKADADLTRVGLIDREWNRQQVRFARPSPHVQVHERGDAVEQRLLTRVDLARNCLNAGLWELLLFTVEDGDERIYEHLWFTFPLGLYKQLFERVNGLSYWSYWWSLEHWVDPTGTPIRLDRIRTIEQEWPILARGLWDEAVATQGEQIRKQKNILTPVAAAYRDWYQGPVQFASFISPGYYSRSHPRKTELHYLADLTGAMVRQVKTAGRAESLFEIELRFRSNKTQDATRLIVGGFDWSAIPVASPEHYERGWQVPLGIGNPSFFESYEQVVATPPIQRNFYGFHLDSQDRWLDHHAIGVDGPLLHRDAKDPSLLHVYLLSYERHAILNHFVLSCPKNTTGTSICL